MSVFTRVSDSIARIQGKRLPPALKQLQNLLTKGLQATTALWPPLERAYGFVHQAAHILANPEQDTEQRVCERYRAHLAQMGDEIATLGPRDACL